MSKIKVNNNINNIQPAKRDKRIKSNSKIIFAKATVITGLVAGGIVISLRNKTTIKKYTTYIKEKLYNQKDIKQKIKNNLKKLNTFLKNKKNINTTKHTVGNSYKTNVTQEKYVEQLKNDFELELYNMDTKSKRKSFSNGLIDFIVNNNDGKKLIDDPAIKLIYNDLKTMLKNQNKPRISKRKEVDWIEFYNNLKNIQEENIEQFNIILKSNNDTLIKKLVDLRKEIIKLK